MSKKDPGGPAFPGLNTEMTGIDSDGTERWGMEPSGGMLLRDYFAGKAMQALLTKQGPYGEDQSPVYSEYVQPVNELAEYAYVQADAMLEARK